MALPIEPCTCTPYELTCCCGPLDGISIVQPLCQTLPDGQVVTNPGYSSSLGKSFWTYKFITDCASSTRAIGNFVIPICESINENFIVVDEKIDGCGIFTPVDFSLTLVDPNFGAAPAGFQWLKVEVDDRYEKGVCVEYRLTITGNYPVATLPIEVKAANNILVFNCEGCFSVPECNPQGLLSVSKQCELEIINNQAILQYTVEVDNIGNASLNNVQYEDIINIPPALTVGTIVVDPPTLNVVVNPSDITISGNLGTLIPGQKLDITYTIPITNISAARTYLITNRAFAFATGTEASDTCSIMLEAVQLTSDKCCIVNGSDLSYIIRISNTTGSPETTVNLTDHLIIPDGVTVEFTDFNGCMAVFEGTNNPVPLNTNITGPVGINITCNNLLVPEGGIAQKIISLKLVSSSIIGTTIIANTLQTVTLDNDNQIFLGAGSLPITALANVTLGVSCENPCAI